MLIIKIDHVISMRCIDKYRKKYAEIYCKKYVKKHVIFLTCYKNRNQVTRNSESTHYTITEIQWAIRISYISIKLQA